MAFSENMNFKENFDVCFCVDVMNLWGDEWLNEKTIWYFQSKSEVCRQSDVCLMTILWLWSLNRGIETGFCTGAHRHFHTEIKHFDNWNSCKIQIPT